MDIIAERIRQRRVDIGMSQSELAKRIGYENRQSIQQIESGKQLLPSNKIPLVAKALDVSDEWLIGCDTADILYDNGLLIERIANTSTKQELIAYASILLQKAQEEK